MPGNAWTRRRSVHRRPPVCKSKPKPEPAQNFPTTMSAQPTWFQADGMDFNSYSLGAFFLARVGTTQEYIATTTNDQGDAFSTSVICNLAPARCVVQFTMLGGPYAGEIISGTTPGWDGSNIWDTYGNALVATGPFFFGTVDLHVP